MKLVAKKPKKFYKNETAWVNAVYRNNKVVINALVKGLGVSGRKALGNMIRDIKKDKNVIRKHKEKGQSKTSVTTGEALDFLGKSEILTPKAQRLRENALRGIRGDKQALDTLRRVTGWNVKLDSENLTWDSRAGAYVYRGKKGTVYIYFDDSPKQIMVVGVD